MDLRAKYVFFEEGFDFVVKDNTENLQDGHTLVSDLEIPTCTIATRTPLHSRGGHSMSNKKPCATEVCYPYIICHRFFY